ncbi:MAG: UDP-N-acetylmuramate dehydrogenase [Acidimicrobiia bacterium]
MASGLIARDRHLGEITTYRFGGPARFFAEVDTEVSLAAVLDAWRSTDGAPPLLILGRGSNLVISDAGFEGLVVRLTGDFAAVEVSEAGFVRAGGAAALPIVARMAGRAGRGGLEFFVGIPGSVGGAVRMNAGGHGSDTAEWLTAARVMDAATGTVRTADVVGLELGYRSSNIGPRDIVLDAIFRTEPRAVAEGEAMMRDVTKWRRERQPGGTLNAGNVFKNPDDVPAGRLIDDVGLKGLTIGGASVSRRHANFFVATDTATAQDVYDLVHEVQRRVSDERGVLLEPEVHFVGAFLDPARGERAGSAG